MSLHQLVILVLLNLEGVQAFEALLQRGAAAAAGLQQPGRHALHELHGEVLKVGVEEHASLEYFIPD